MKSVDEVVPFFETKCYNWRKIFPNNINIGLSIGPGQEAEEEEEEEVGGGGALVSHRWGEVLADVSPFQWT